MFLVLIITIAAIIISLSFYCCWKRRQKQRELLREPLRHVEVQRQATNNYYQRLHTSPPRVVINPQPVSYRPVIPQPNPPSNPTLQIGYVVNVDDKLAMVQTDGPNSAYFELDEESECIKVNALFPKLHDQILIKGMEHEPTKYITKYDVIPFNGVEVEEEIGVVVDLPAPGVISIISRSIPSPIEVECNFKVARHDLVLGTVKRLRPHFKPDIYEDEYWITKDSVENPSTTGILCMFNVTQLGKPTADMIETNCRNVENMSLYVAEKCIRDVYIAISWLDLYLQNETAWEYTVQASGSAWINTKTSPSSYTITIYLTNKQAKKLIFTQSTETWRVGTELSMRHPDLSSFIKNTMRQHEGGMIVEAITKHDEDWTRVDLKPAPRSKDLFDLLQRSHSTEPLSSEDKNGKKCFFTVGPSIDDRNTIAENLEVHFRRFFENEPLFDAWRGAARPNNTQVPRLYEDFLVNNCRLDPSQRTALRTAISRRGFTSVEAPPGSGKTFLIASIVALKKEQDSVSKGRICVSASTNTAITNALDVTHRFFENISKTRQYSKTAEGQVSGASKEISLKHMAENAGRYVDLRSNPNLLESMRKYETAKEGLQNERSRKSGMQKVAGKESASSNLKQNFFEAYCPFLIGSTCEMVARRPTDKERKIAEQIDEGRRPDLRECVTHLILDEASQLPPHMALAVYVALPTVEKITVIGDTRQLGPFTKLDEGSFAHKLVGIGELERLNRNNCTNRTELTTIYRCHPRIMDLMMKPIYGPHLNAGTAEKDRNLAYAKNLPVAEDWSRSPALFVNVDGNCVNGYNQKEAEVVLGFINFLKKRGITGEDVAVICNHKAQREKISAQLKGKGNFGIMRTSVAIHTIDSFQGKEAKVVLVLTTKTCGASQNPKKTLSFVSHPNRGTVAVSRAQHAVYVFGQWEKLAQTDFWKQFVPTIVENMAIVDSNWQPASEELYSRILNGSGSGSNRNRQNGQKKKKKGRTVVNSSKKKKGQNSKSTTTQSNY